MNMKLCQGFDDLHEISFMRGLVGSVGNMGMETGDSFIDGIQW
jgi:hypothetical protein